MFILPNGLERTTGDGSFRLSCGINRRIIGAANVMTDQELETLLKDIESDVVERKESLAGDARDTVRQAICAFANDLPDHRKPGVLFVGARDDGSCAGLPITNELLLTLANMKTDGNILPIPSMSV